MICAFTGFSPTRSEFGTIQALRGGRNHVRPFEVGNDQASQGCERQCSCEGIRQVDPSSGSRGPRGRRDPATNASLRTMFQKARESSVPIDTIERAIKRGTGELEGVRYESISYEGYAPGGVAVIVETLTDNRNRTSAEIKHVFARTGGPSPNPGRSPGSSIARA